MNGKMTVIAVLKPSPQFEKMKAVSDACIAAGIAPPQSVIDYFCMNNWKQETISLLCEQTGRRHAAISDFGNITNKRCEIDISRLPERTEKIRIEFL